MTMNGAGDHSLYHPTKTMKYITFNVLLTIGPYTEFRNERRTYQQTTNDHKKNNETISTMSHEETSMTIDANVDTTTATEPLDTGHVEDAPIVSVPKPKKSKRASSRNVPKRGSLVDDDNFSPPKLSIATIVLITWWSHQTLHLNQQTVQLTYPTIRP